MKLVHGTSNKNLKRIQKYGILPRLKKKGEWDVVSNPKAIYLSTAYAFHYALNASKNIGTLIEIETDLIENANLSLMADEDALEQAWRITKGKIFPFVVPDFDNMKTRTEWFSKNLLLSKLCGYDHEWSLKHLGNCCFFGSIPKKAIIRIVNIKDINQGWWLSFFDPTITFANFLYMGKEYQTIQEVLLGKTDELLQKNPENLDHIIWLEDTIKPRREIIFIST